MEKKFLNKKGGCICGAIQFNVILDELPRAVSYTHLTLPTSDLV